MSSTISTDSRLRDRAIARSLPLMPRRLVQRISAPYIAGVTMADALRTVDSLAARGMGTTIDVLGEAITRREQAIATRDAYLETIAALAAHDGRDGHDGHDGRDPQPHDIHASSINNVSVKLTALGLGIDDDLVHDNVREIAAAITALPHGFLRIDMEDAPYTDATLALYRRLRDGDGFGDKVGIVIQAYLKRSRADVEQLAAEGARVRIVKGIYQESETIAYRDMHTINQNFVHLCRVLGEAGCHVAYATHDDRVIDGCVELVRELDLSRERYEFQMLLGVREQRRDDLLDQGHPMRVYVPYGAQWYEYSLRRLRENPRVAGHVAADVLQSWRRRLTRR